ncbi:MAG: hypothetical protein JXA96_01675 [Sedimentisphaerales bacterium]|nr:hypothetical protein [Sedimentisphaerales bacterium]
MEANYTFTFLNGEKYRNRILYMAILVLLILGQYSNADPNSFQSDQYAATAIRYRLVEGSTLTVSSTVEDVLPVQVPVRGYFWLKRLPSDPLFKNYSVNHLKFQSTDSSLLSYSGSLSGTYRVGGEVALLQQMVLKGKINDSKEMLFDSGLQSIDVNFPWIEIEVFQLFPDSMRVIDLHLVAVPWPKIRFSTATSFTSSSGVKVSDGDIISTSGKIIRRNNQLTGKLGIMPIVPDLGLDAMMLQKLSNTDSVSNSRAIYFSLPQDVFSETLGYLHNGDLLSDKGSVIKTYKDFISPFGPMPPIADYGLDAVVYSNRGEFLFSIEKDFFSEILGKNISNGDLLSEKGYVFKTNSKLLSKFKLYPTFAPIDIGLDAVYIWPWGEVWFSTKSSFPVEQYENIRPGDLISSYGKVVFRNSELLKAFKPTEKIADFGLDALEILWPNLEANLNEDDVVDLADYSIFINAWKPGSSDNDYDSDCIVIDGNPVDIQELLACFEALLEEEQ